MDSASKKAASKGRGKAKKSRGPRRRQDADPPAEPGFPVVGIGASAGGLAAITAFFDSLGEVSDLAFVVIEHLAPSHQSRLPELIALHTRLHVVSASDGMAIEPGSVYVIQPGTMLYVEGARLRTTKAGPHTAAHKPVDRFLRTLAPAFGSRAVALILSGSGTDGSLGVRSVKEEGGLILVQDPEEAGFDGMPRSVIATGAVDLVLPVAELAKAVRGYAGRRSIGSATAEAVPSPLPDDVLAQVIGILKASKSHEFGSYKPAMLMRRIQRRMAMHMLDTPAAYLDYLRKTPGEREALFQDFLINVTCFFRDPAAFDFLEKEVVPELVRSHDGGRPLRVWVPGCSSGEEAYSIAMLLIEGLAAAGKETRLQVFATDVDTIALDVGRRGLYPDSIEADVSPERLRRFFKRQDHTYEVQPQLRDCLVFAAQNLLSNAPFSNLDLISCRNLLIYLRSEVQERVLRLLHFALVPGGVLLLGPSETIGTERARFEPISQKHRIFRRVGRSTPADLAVPVRTTGPVPAAPAQAGPGLPARPVSLAELCQRTLLQSYAPASVLITPAGEALHFFGSIDRFLRIAAGDANQQLVPMAREGLRARLSEAVRQARDDDGHATATGAYLRQNGDVRAVTIEVRPVEDQGERLLLVSFSEQPATEGQPAPAAALESDDAAAVVTRLERELETTRGELQASIRDLETSNEELRATNEEAMSLNEEFQSTNEELETSKEELQSLNEELNTVNAELQEKVDSLRRSNDDLANLLAATDIATLFLDRDFRIRFFTPAVKRLFSVIESDVGRPLSDFANRVRDPALLADAEGVLADLVPIEREVHGENGSWFNRRVGPYRTEDDRIGGVIVTFIDITGLKTSEQEALVAKAYAEAIVDTVRQPLLVLDPRLKAISASASFYRAFHLTAQDVKGRQIAAIGRGELKSPKLSELLERILPERTTVEDFEAELLLPYGRRSFLVNARRMERHDGGDLILLAMEDVTERKLSGAELIQQTLQATSDAVVLVGPDGKIVQVNEPAERLFGQAAEAVRGEPIEILLPERLRQRHRQHVKDFFADPVPRLMGAARSLDIIGLTTDGRELPLQISLAAVKAAEGPIAVATIRDLSAQRDVERQLEKAKALAEDASRRRSDLLAAASQNLRQPLQTLGVLENALARTLGGPDARELLGRIGVVTNTMTDVLNALLDLNQLERSEIEPQITDFKVADTLERMRTEFGHVATTKRLELRVMRSSLAVRSDVSLLDRILQNLVSNALRYTASGKVLIGCRRRGKTVRLEVWDTGPGIPPELEEAIFTPFFRIEGERAMRSERAGLGLYLVRRLADLLGHRIELRSTIGKGSMFAVELPLCDRPPERRAPAPVSPGQEGKPAEILLLTEQDDAGSALELLLRLEGYAVRAVWGPQQALEVAHQDVTPSLIVADQWLGGDMTGLEAIRTIRQRCGGEVPAIVLANDGSSEALAGIADSGCTGLVKPVKAEDFLAHAAKLLRDAGARLPERYDAARAAPPDEVEKDARDTIFIIEHEAELRERLARRLVEVGYRVESFADAERFFASFDRSRKGCLLCDLDLAGASGLDLQQVLSTEGSDLPIVLIAGRRSVGRAVAGIQAGAVDVLEKPIDDTRLLGSVEQALARGRRSGQTAAARSEAEAKLARLTTREREILTLVVAGHASKEIAARLGISRRTAENHRARIREKTGARSLADLVRLAALVQRGH